jgi:large subunit ribosomal protein L25
MADFIQLGVKKRDVVGKQVRTLRREGFVPAVVYGPESDPLNLSIDQLELRAVLMQAGGTQLIELNVDSGENIPTLARHVQRDPVRGDLMHVDFYRVSMNRPISADVPVILVNESPIVSSGGAVVIHPMSSLSIEALPAALPPHIEVDMSLLQEVGDQLLVEDLNLPEGAVAQVDGAELVVKLDYPRQIIEEEEEEEEELLFGEEVPEVEVITERRQEEEEEEE